MYYIRRIPVIVIAVAVVAGVAQHHNRPVGSSRDDY